ncbi:MAG: phage neck terminator protein [Myxococcota bacterium]
MNVVDLENAIRAWVLSSSGLSAGAVVFAHQDGRVPEEGAYISLGDIVQVGLDELRWSFDPGQPAGQEVGFTTNGPRTFTVTCSFFGGPTTGSPTSRSRALDCQSALRLPTVRSALNAAGLGVLQEGTVRWVPAMDGTGWQGGAVLEVLFCARQTASERTGYISQYEGSATLTGA